MSTRAKMQVKKHVLGLLPFLWFPLAIFVLHIVLSFGFKAYVPYPWLDIPMHLVGGAAIAYFFYGGLCYLDGEKLVVKPEKRLFNILIVSLVATAAVFWEFAEFLSDRFLGTSSQVSISNVLKDQCLGIVGGVLFVLYGEFMPGRKTGR